MYGVVQVSKNWAENAPILQKAYYNSLLAVANFLQSLAKTNAPIKAEDFKLSGYDPKGFENNEDLRVLQEVSETQLHPDVNSRGTGIQENALIPVDKDLKGKENFAGVKVNPIPKISKINQVSQIENQQIIPNNNIKDNQRSSGVAIQGSGKSISRIEPPGEVSSITIDVKLTDIKKKAGGTFINLEIENLDGSKATKGKYFTILKSLSEGNPGQSTYYIKTTNGVKEISSLKEASARTIKTALEVGQKSIQKLSLDFSAYPLLQEKQGLFFIYVPENESIIAKYFLIKNENFSFESSKNGESM